MKKKYKNTKTVVYDCDNENLLCGSGSNPIVSFNPIVAPVNGEEEEELCED